MAEEKNLLEGVHGTIKIDGTGSIAVDIHLGDVEFDDGLMLLKKNVALANALIDCVTPRMASQKYLYLTILAKMLLLERDAEGKVAAWLERIADELADDIASGVKKVVIRTERGKAGGE